MPAALTVNVASGAVRNAAIPGNCGQVIGADIADAESRIGAAMNMYIAQWCAPCRRQHCGKFAFSLSINTDSGPNPKNAIRKMEKPRRI